MNCSESFQQAAFMEWTQRYQDQRLKKKKGYQCYRVHTVWQSWPLSSKKKDVPILQNIKLCEALMNKVRILSVLLCPKRKKNESRLCILLNIQTSLHLGFVIALYLQNTVNCCCVLSCLSFWLILSINLENGDWRRFSPWRCVELWLIELI